MPRCRWQSSATRQRPGRNADPATGLYGHRFDNLRMDYIDKSNLIGDERYSDRITYDGTKDVTKDVRLSSHYSRDIKGLQESGIITREGGNTFGEWTIKQISL